MRKTSNGGFAIGGGSSNIGAGSGDVDPTDTIRIPDVDGVSHECKPGI